MTLKTKLSDHALNAQSIIYLAISNTDRTDAQAVMAHALQNYNSAQCHTARNFGTLANEVSSLGGKQNSANNQFGELRDKTMRNIQKLNGGST